MPLFWFDFLGRCERMEGEKELYEAKKFYHPTE
jgi:hypothetical protein